MVATCNQVFCSCSESQGGSSAASPGPVSPSIAGMARAYRRGGGEAETGRPHQGVRGASTQNSFPSGSASTTHDTSGPWLTLARVAPIASRRAISASWSSGRKSRCRRFFSTFGSSTGTNNRPGSRSGAGRISTSSSEPPTETQPRACCHHRPRAGGSCASTMICSHSRLMATTYARPPATNSWARYPAPGPARRPAEVSTDRKPGMKPTRQCGDIRGPQREGIHPMADEQLEREYKYAAPPQYRLPEVSGALPTGGRQEQATLDLDSMYFDTEQHDLLAHGVTLRRRTGAVDNGWQLKVPAGDARTEIRLAPTADDTAVPAELAELTLGLRRGRSLRRIVTIRTSRTAHRLLTADGRVIVEVADDHVDAVAPGHRSATVNSWREIEAELGAAGTVEDLDTVNSRLIKSGLQAAASPNKVATALGVVSVTDPKTGEPTTGDVIQEYLREQDDALVAGDLSLRRGLGGIHPTRV